MEDNERRRKEGRKEGRKEEIVRKLKHFVSQTI